MRNNHIPQKKNSIWTTIARTLVSVGLLLILFSQIELKSFLKALSGISIHLLISIPFLFMANILLSAVRWQVILKNFDVQERFLRIFLIYFISFFWSNFLPTTIGGDGYRFFEMRKRNPEKDSEILASILLDRVNGFLVLCFVHVVSISIFWKVIFQNKILLTLEALIFSGIGVVYLIWISRIKLKNMKIVRKFFIKKILAKVEEVVSVIKKQTRSVNWQVSFASLFFVLISSFALQIYYLAAGSNVNYFYAIYVNTLSNIVGVLPFSINGLGLFELPQLIAMETVGIGAETILVAALFMRAMGLLLSAVGGGAYLAESWISTFSRVER